MGQQHSQAGTSGRLAALSDLKPCWKQAAPCSLPERSVALLHYLAAGAWLPALACQHLAYSSWQPRPDPAGESLLGEAQMRLPAQL